MTIRILTSHPALRYVLGRSAPLGTTVWSPTTRHRSGPNAIYAINIDSQDDTSAHRKNALCAWIPSYVLQYGAQRIEINGRPVLPEELQLRRALSGRRRS